MNHSLYALVLAGGSGERFWPLSRKRRPKQLLQLLSQETLLAGTLRRLEGLVPPERILILTNQNQEAETRRVLPNFPPENILTEPAKRDTAAAIALGAAWIGLRDPHATMVVLAADHLISDAAAFQRDIATAALLAGQTGNLVTIGIQPTWPCTGFGYLELGPAVSVLNVEGCFHEVVRFREKPDSQLAESFLRQGGFRWNAGIFVWTVSAIFTEFERHAPELATFVAQAHANGDLAKTVQTRFATLPKISIDYAILEKASRVFAVEATFDWDDVGTWSGVAKHFPVDAQGNRANVPLSTLDSEGNLVFSDSPCTVALLGVRDLIVVRTGDALLVCNRHDAERIKHLVTKLPEELQ